MSIIIRNFDKLGFGDTLAHVSAIFTETQLSVTVKGGWLHFDDSYKYRRLESATKCSTHVGWYIDACRAYARGDMTYYAVRKARALLTKSLSEYKNTYM